MSGQVGQYSDPEWLRKNVGPGNVFEGTGQLDDAGVEILRDTSSAKIPYDELAQHFKDAAIKKLEAQLSTGFKYASAEQIEIFTIGAKKNIARQTAGMINLSSDLSQNAATRAVVAKAMAHAEAGAVDSAFSVLDNAVKVGDIDEDTADDIRADMRKIVAQQEKAAKRGVLDGLYLETTKQGAGEEDPELGRDASDQFINDLTGLEKPERSELQSRSDDFWNVKDAEFEADQAEYHDKLNARIAAKDLTITFEDYDTVLYSRNREKRIAGWEKQVARVEKIKKGEKDPNDEFDPDTWKEISERIGLDPKSVNAKTDIWEKVGLGTKGGLSTAQAKSLDALQKTNIARLNSGLSAKDPIDISANAFFSDYEAIQRKEATKFELNAEKQRQFEIRAVYIREDFAAWRAGPGKDATQDEATKKQIELTAPIREEIKLSGWLKFSRFAFEERALIIERKEEQLIAEGIWARWTVEQKTQARELIRQGLANDDVVKQVEAR